MTKADIVHLMAWIFWTAAASSLALSIRLYVSLYQLIKLGVTSGAAIDWGGVVVNFLELTGPWLLFLSLALWASWRPIQSVLARVLRRRESP